MKSWENMFWKFHSIKKTSELFSKFLCFSLESHLQGSPSNAAIVFFQKWQTIYSVKHTRIAEPGFDDIYWVFWDSLYNKRHSLHCPSNIVVIYPNFVIPILLCNNLSYFVVVAAVFNKRVPQIQWKHQFEEDLVLRFQLI